MKLTRASSYALAALAYLAREKPDAPVASHDMATRANGIPKKFLLKILRPLASVGILRSIRGPNGGYQLARAPKDVTLLEVVEAVDGPIRGLAEPVGDGEGRALDKRLQAVCEEAASLVREWLTGYAAYAARQHQGTVPATPEFFTPDAQFLGSQGDVGRTGEGEVTHCRGPPPRIKGIACRSTRR